MAKKTIKRLSKSKKLEATKPLRGKGGPDAIGA
jgi:hypothetical protein